MPLSSEYMAEYMLRRYHSRRAAAIGFLGGVCAECGSDEDLHIDHIDPATKSFAIFKMWSVSKERFWAEVAKCQLLCRTHHEAKTLAGRENIPHNLAMGEQIVQSKLSEADVLRIRAMSDSMSIGALAKEFGVTRGNVGHILARRTWKHI